jgi:DNA-binding transcriptional LysR family regulator
VTKAEWNDFELLLALSRGGSIAAAARLLGVDNSTVSRKLASFERTLGATLLLRGGREFTLTAEGRIAVEAANAMESIAAGAVASIRAAKEDIAGVVRISTVADVVQHLMPLLAEVAERYPKLVIELSSAVPVVDLAKGDADIAIRFLEPTNIDLIARRAVEWEMGVYASRAYAATHGLPDTYDGLREHRLIQYNESMLRMPWFSWIEEFAKPGAHATRVESPQVAHALMSAGAGIGVIACATGDASPDLVRVFSEPVACAVGWIVYHESARNSARIRATVDLLLEFFGKKTKAGA